MHTGAVYQLYSNQHWVGTHCSPSSIQTLTMVLVLQEHVSTLVLLFAGSTLNGRDDNVPHDATRTPSPGASDATSADAAVPAGNNSGSLLPACLLGTRSIVLP